MKAMSLLIAVMTVLYTDVIAAFQLDAGASTSVRVTDNVALSNVEGVSSRVTSATFNAKFDEAGNTFGYNANTLLKIQKYSDNAFARQSNFKLGLNANWVMAENWINWTMSDSFRQTKINSLVPDTPDNLQDTNLFSIGPNISIPISSRQSVSITPKFRRFYFENSNINNKQNNISLSWSYSLLPNISLNLGGGVTDTVYDDPGISGNSSKSVNIGFSGSGSRSKYSVTFGVINSESDDGVNQRGNSGGINWVVDFTETSSLKLKVSSKITEAGSVLINSAEDSINGDFSDLQIVAGVFRNKIARLEYRKQFSAVSPNIWIEQRSFDYNTATSDNEIQSAGFSLQYQNTENLSSGLLLKYSKRGLADQSQKDKDTDINVNFGYKLSNKIRAQFSINLRNRDGALPTSDYDERSILFSLSYD